MALIDPSDSTVVAIVEKMPFPKGRKVGDGTPGPGRPKGSQSRASETLRFIITSFADANAARVQQLWDELADKDPGKALDMYAKMLEFSMPKLQRQEIIQAPPVPAVEDIPADASADQASEIYLRAAKG